MKFVASRPPRRYWIGLLEYKDKWIRRGSTLKINFVDNSLQQSSSTHKYLIFDPLERGVYGLLHLSGENAGSIKTIFPDESSEQGHVGLKRDWLIANWNSWVDPNSLASRVIIKSP